MAKYISKCIQIYKDQLEAGYIQEAYMVLTKYIAELKNNFPQEYSTGGISFGYLDYTYFPFFNKYLRSEKLRFGIVLNHQKMQIELWLMGQNETIQRNYWEFLKNTKWNKHLDKRPIYSVLEVCLEDKINFDDKDDMTKSILHNAVRHAKEIQLYIEQNKE